MPLCGNICFVFEEMTGDQFLLEVPPITNGLNVYGAIFFDVLEMCSITPSNQWKNLPCLILKTPPHVYSSLCISSQD